MPASIMESPIVLSMGTYNISVSAEGYKTYSSTIAVNEPLVEEKIILEKLVQPKAMLSVESNPAGASVYANDVLIGTTPFSAQIEYGDYRITFKKDGYSDYTINTSSIHSAYSIQYLQHIIRLCGITCITCTTTTFPEYDRIFRLW